MKDIKDIDVKNKKVILRLDLNVTIKNDVIIDDTKIKESIPTIKYLLEQNAHILIMSHLGKIKSEEDKLHNSLRAVSERLATLLGEDVVFVPETCGDILESSFANNSLTLMENTRFEDYPDKKESQCDDELAQYWASLGDVFINDAFGTTHRKHASNYGIAKYLPTGYGFLIKKEIVGLSPIINDIKKPFAVIMGGAKVDDKIKLIAAILKECDQLFVGGGIANTFIKASGHNIGCSLYSAEYVAEIKTLIEENRDKIYMPLDVVVMNSQGLETKYIDNINDDDNILDIGPLTVLSYLNNMLKAKTIFLNGTMGKYEDDLFKKGTESLYSGLKDLKAEKIAGGGDALSSIHKLGYEDVFAFLSTGGGATLEYIANKHMLCFEHTAD